MARVNIKQLNRQGSIGNMSLRMAEEWIDVTTQVGCPCACLKYCPQEILVKRYTSPQKTLTVENFERMLKNLPKSLPIFFSGFCEPFANPNVVELMEASARSGHEIGLLTTLYGSTRAQIERLLKLKLKMGVPTLARWASL